MGGLFWVGPYASVFSRGFAARSRVLRANFAATPLVCPAQQNRHATQATRTRAIWSWVILETSKTKVNYSVDFVGHRELAIFFKFFTIGREYTPLTIKIVGRDIKGTYHFHLGWVRGWCSGQFFQVTGMIEVCFFSWFEIFRSKIFWDKPFLAVNLLKYSKYSFFFGVDFSFHGSSPSLGIWSTHPV